MIVVMNVKTRRSGEGTRLRTREEMWKGKGGLGGHEGIGFTP